MKDNMLGISWHDSAWIPNLKPTNVLDYFAERSNPFYDRTCNNEIVKMQRLNPEQLNNMAGIEYILLHVQEPILYVIRKQHRHSINQVTPVADYYIIAGIVYQAPDLASVINARILSCGHHLQSAFDEALSFSRYHPSKGYWWEFKDADIPDKTKPKEKGKEEPSSLFQRQRVDMLLADLTRKYPPKYPPAPQVEKPPAEEVKPEVKQEIKQEKMDGAANANQLQNSANKTNCKPPPEKKPRL